MLKKRDTVLSLLLEIRDCLKAISLVVFTFEKLFETKPNGRFQKLEDGWIKDNLLGIDWSLEDKKMIWNQAKTEGINLPTIKQLETLIDRTKFNPAIIEEAKVLNLKTDDWYWAAEPCMNPGWSDGAWMVHFGYGLVSIAHKDSNDYVRPVRPSK